MQKKENQRWILIQHEPLDVGAAFAFLQTPRAGGIDLFVGTTRQWTDDKETVQLEYDCYEAMALKEIERLAEEARERWPVERVCLFHRLGIVPPAEASVVVGVATPHRHDAFDACRFLIDWLKTKAPFWKLENTDSGERWVEARESDTVAEERWIVPGNAGEKTID